MDAVGYARVSTEDQSDHGVSLDVQPEKIRSCCAAFGLALVDLVVADESAKTLRRAGLSRALSLLDSGAADALVVAKLDRLTRDVGDWSQLLRRYFSGPKARVLYTPSGPADTATAAGRLLLNIQFSVSQWEREVIVERTREALDHKRGRGDRTGSVPFGFASDPHGPVNRHGRPVGLVADPAEQLVIDLIKALRDAGAGARAIARRLNADGVATKTGRAPWTHSAVAKILARPDRERTDPQ